MQRFLTPLVLLMVPVAACAQKGPELGYVFPPVVQAGTKTPVVLGGYDFTPDMQLFVHDERCRIEILGPPGEFIIPPPPYWFGEKGSSPAFPIPREIPATVTVPADCPAGPVRWQVANANGASATAVFLVSDGNEVLETRDRDRPQPIDALPAAVSGRLSRIAEIDRYQIVADRDGPVTVELFARRLGADFNGVIEVRNAAGRIIADVADTEGRDAAVTFRAAAGQTYSVGLHDVDFRGNRAFVYRLAFTPGPRIVTTLPASLSAPGRQPVALDGPCVFTALLDANGTASFSWQAVKGEFWSIRAESQSLGTGLDLALSIQDSSGKQLAFSDDLQNTTDPGLEFKVPADGVYRCVLSDLSGNSGELTSIYRLTLRRAAPDYRLSVPQTVNLPVGGKTSLQIDVERLGGFNEPIAIQLRGLPEGVSASGELTVPAGKTVLKLTLEASPETPAVAGFLTVQGSAGAVTDDGSTSPRLITRTATAVAAGNLCPRSERDTAVSRVLLATTLAPKFSVELVDKNRQRAVHRGTTYPAPFRIVREDGFAGDVLLQMAARQGRHRQGIHGPVLTVPGDVGEALYPCFMPEWLATDRTTRMVVLGVARQADASGQLRYVTKPADARITMILEGALLKVEHDAGELSVPLGQSFEVPVHVSRSAKLQTPVTLTLAVPDDLRDVVALDEGDVTLPVSQTDAVLRITTAGTDSLSGRWTVRLQAHALQDGQWRVMSQTDLTFDLLAPGTQARSD